MIRTVGTLLLPLALGMSLSGCAARSSPEPSTRPATRPAAEVLPLDELVLRVNANNARIPSLWSRGYFEALVRRAPGDDGNFVNGQVFVQHLKPDRLRIKAEKDAFGDVFDFGTDGERIFARLPQEDVIYLGTLGRLDPEKTAGLPIRPDLVLEVLGIGLIPAELDAFPAPTLRYDPDGELHRVAFVEPALLGMPRLKISKEVWYDVLPTGTPVPRRVILHDDAGRPVLVATLQRHEPVAEDAGPLVATRWLLYFPPTGSKMLIELEDVRFERRRRGRAAPTVATFDFDAGRYPEPTLSLDLAPDATGAGGR